MRIAMTLTVLLGMTAAATAQRPPVEVNPAPRFNVLYNERFFKQASPKDTLASVVKAADLRQFDYITVYLMDEAYADGKIAERARDFEGAVERGLRAERARDRADPFKPAMENRLPLDPIEFGKRIQAEATQRGYRQLVAEVRERFVEDPSYIRELQRYLRDGEVTLADTTAKMTLKAEKGKAIYFKKIGSRWFMEDRLTEAPAAAAPNN